MHLCDPVRKAWLDFMVLSGQVNIPDYFRNKRKYQKCRWYAPGWEWIDPQKEANANKIALETGQTTLAEICAGYGQDWKDVLKQREKR